MAHHHHTPDLHEHADSWHRHGADEGRPQHEHAGVISPVALTKVFVALSVTVIFLIVILHVFYTNSVNKLKAEKFETDTLAAGWSSTKAQWATELTTYETIGDAGWRIPVDKAMDKVVAKYQNRPETPAK